MSNIITQLLSRHRTGKWLHPRTYEIRELLLRTVPELTTKV
jgi:hypothetical protein